MYIRALQRGVTVIELAIVAGIFGTLAAAAMPDVDAFIARSQVRAASDALRAALRVAQLEALERGTTVELVLTDDAPVGTQASPLPSPSGRNLVVRTRMRDGSRTTLYTYEGALATPRVRVAADRAVFGFDAFGRLSADSVCAASPAGQCAIRIEDIGSALALRPALQVRVGPAGSSTNCNPGLPSGSTFACS